MHCALPEKTADIWRRYRWFPRQMTGKPVVASPNVGCFLDYTALPSTQKKTSPILIEGGGGCALHRLLRGVIGVCDKATSIIILSGDDNKIERSKNHL